jgi:hypothetical protein
MKNRVTGAKLPSHDGLRILFFNMREVNLSLHKSASLVKEVFIFRRKASIPIRESYHNIGNVIQLVERLYGTWKDLKKHKTRQRESCRQNEQKSKNTLNDFFDIAHSNALEIITLYKDKQFSLSQRLKRRPGCMLGINKKFYSMELENANR